MIEKERGNNCYTVAEQNKARITQNIQFEIHIIAITSYHFEAKLHDASLHKSV